MKKAMSSANVLAAFAERGDANRHDREAMEKILAERTAGDQRREIARARRDDADIDIYAGRAADTEKILLDQHPQDLALGLPGHIGDFVEVERAAVGFLERANLAGCFLLWLHFQTIPFPSFPARSSPS